MPLPENVSKHLDATHRQSLKEALRECEDARAQCLSMGKCGIDARDQLERIDGCEQLAYALLKEFFGE